MTCLDCGRDVGPTSLRCRKCHGALLTRLSIEENAEFDRALLELVELGISMRSIGTMLGVSGARAHQKVQAARWRETQRQ
jgi:hypothetical protein